MSVTLLAVAGYVFVATVLVVLLTRAPHGYEDERGFHSGDQPLRDTIAGDEATGKWN